MDTKRIRITCTIFFLFVLLAFGLSSVWAGDFSNPFYTDRKLSLDTIELRIEEFYTANDLETASYFIETGLKDYPASAKLWDYKALICFRKKNYKGALKAAVRALELTPTAQRYVIAGGLYQSTEQYNEAIKCYRMGERLGIKNTRGFYFHMADCLERTGQKQGAINYYKKYIQHSPAGPMSKEAERRIKLLDDPEAACGLGMTAAEWHEVDALCSQRFPGSVAVSVNPKTKKIECGCPEGRIYTGKGCICKLELEIMKALKARDIDRAERLAAQADEQGCKLNKQILEDVKFLVKMKKTKPWILDKKAFDEKPRQIEDQQRKSIEGK